MRAVIYVSAEGVGEQVEQLLTYCEARQYEVVGVVHSLTGAEQMVALGEAEVLVLTSRTVLPMHVETITREIKRLGYRQRPERFLARLRSQHRRGRPDRLR